MDNQPTSDLWTELRDAAADARKRLQRRSPGWWRDEVAPGVTRADRVGALVTMLVDHDPAAAGRGVPRRPRRDETLADQLAVVLHDLTLVEDVDVETVLAEVLRALRDVDPRS